MRVVVMGPPGAGKGTQSTRLAKAWGVPHVSTGDLLRQAVRQGTNFGRRIEHLLNSGCLISDESMAEILKGRLGRTDCRRGFVLDGYPRTERQAQDLDEMLAGMGASLDWTLLIEVAAEVLVQRLSGRRLCPSCQTIVHVDQLPPGDAERCQNCGTMLVTRADDEESTVRRRLAVYEEQTRPALEHYRRQGKLKVTDGRSTPNQVYERLVSIVQAAHR